jgi:hypothetical protein
MIILINAFEMVDLRLCSTFIENIMITFEEAAIMGINAPWTHQRIIAKLTIGLGTMFYGGIIHLEPLPETMLDEDKTSPVPDILLHDNILEQTKVIIEITRTKSVTADYKKVKKLILEEDYGIEEGFVYDYKLNIWHKYKLGVGDIIDKPSFCEAINLDLATLL